MPSLLARLTGAFKDGYRTEGDALDRSIRAAAVLAGTEARLAKLAAGLLVVQCLVGATLAGVIVLLVKAFI